MTFAIYGSTKGRQLPINVSAIASPVEPSRHTIPRAAARSEVTVAEAVPPIVPATEPKADRARSTSSCAERPVMTMSSRATTSPPDEPPYEVNIHCLTCLADRQTHPLPEIPLNNCSVQKIKQPDTLQK